MSKDDGSVETSHGIWYNICSKIYCGWRSFKGICSMEKLITIILIFIALMSGGYRMDEQFFPSERAVSWSYVKPSKVERIVLFFKNKDTRYRFLRAAVIQQYIAYAYLLLNIVLALLTDTGISSLIVRNINTYYIGCDLVFVLTVGIFYKVYR